MPGEKQDDLAQGGTEQIHMKRLMARVSIIFLLIITGAPGVQAGADGAVRYPIVDNHVHFFDFTQRSDGFQLLIQAMDKAGVEKAVVFGIPMIKMWTESDPIRPYYYLDTDSHVYYYSGTDFLLAHELLSQPRQVQDRFFPFVCGINPLDMNAADQIETLLKMYPGFWKGIGEVMSRHDDLTAFLYGEPPRADHPALMKVYKLAVRYELPVLIHHDISSVWKREPIYLKELENALRENPEMTLIWAHAGISRRVDVPGLLSFLRKMLSTYPHLFIDISWVVYPDYILKDEEATKQWVVFIEEFPDRVMIGSDQVGHWKNYPDTITKYHILLDSLQPDTAAMIARGNILRILGEGALVKK